MKTLRPFFCVGLLGLFISSCKQSQHGDNQQASCTYTVIQDSLKVEWFAYKTTEKVEVGGTFDQVLLLGTVSSNSLGSLIQGARVLIPVSSVNTNNPDRDSKIKAHFFGKMEGTDTISLYVTKVEGNDEQGLISIALRLNNVEKTIELPYRYSKEGTLIAEKEIDLTQWYAQNALAALNQVCYDLHKGADGISKLWEMVKIRLRATIKKECNTGS